MTTSLQKYDCRLQKYDCRLQKYDCRLQKYDCRLQKYDCRLRKNDCRLQKYDCRLQKYDCRLQKYDCRLQKYDCRLHNSICSIQVQCTNNMCCYIQKTYRGGRPLTKIVGGRPPPLPLSLVMSHLVAYQTAVETRPNSHGMHTHTGQHSRLPCMHTLIFA